MKGTKQLRYIYHGHVHSKIGTMIGRTAVASEFGAQVLNVRFFSGLILAHFVLSVRKNTFF